MSIGSSRFLVQQEIHEKKTSIFSKKLLTNREGTVIIPIKQIGIM